MKFAIIICTYQRKNGSTPKHLDNMFKMLYNQEYQQFKVFLIGDTYENNDEFEKICKSYNGDIYYENSPINFRTGYFKQKINKWSSGGSNSRFIGVKKAIEEGFDYYIHLDDDDIWKPNHISSFVNIIKNYPEVDFMISKSLYKRRILPREHNKIKKIFYNNFKVRPENSVHSSWLINLNTLGDILIELFNNRLEHINKIKNKKIKETRLFPFDAHQLNIFSKLQNQNKIKCICNNIITCCKKSDINIPQ